ncbi:unnamed protein product [Cutaneotrichosporon oleaginosum]
MTPSSSNRIRHDNLGTLSPSTSSSTTGSPCPSDATDLTHQADPTAALVRKVLHETKAARTCKAYAQFGRYYALHLGAIFHVFAGLASVSPIYPPRLYILYPNDTAARLHTAIGHLERTILPLAALVDDCLQHRLVAIDQSQSEPTRSRRQTTSSPQPFPSLKQVRTEAAKGEAKSLYTLLGHLRYHITSLATALAQHRRDWPLPLVLGHSLEIPDGETVEELIDLQMQHIASLERVLTVARRLGEDAEVCEVKQRFIADLEGTGIFNGTQWSGAQSTDIALKRVHKARAARAKQEQRRKSRGSDMGLQRSSTQNRQLKTNSRWVAGSSSSSPAATSQNVYLNSLRLQETDDGPAIPPLNIGFAFDGERT